MKTMLAHEKSNIHCQNKKNYTYPQQQKPI